MAKPGSQIHQHHNTHDVLIGICDAFEITVFVCQTLMHMSRIFHSSYLLVLDIEHGGESGGGGVGGF